MQGKFEERLEYGFHRVFILAALLDPALYPHVNSISMEERVQAEDLVMQFFPSRPFGNAAVAQLKAYREGKHGIPEYAFENPALVADAVGFWRDYGSENSALKHIARVAIRVLGIPPTAAGMPQTLVPQTICFGPTCVVYARPCLCTAKPHSHAMQAVSVAGPLSGVYGVTTGTASSQAEWLCLSIATTTRGCWTVHTKPGHARTGTLSSMLWSRKRLSRLPKGMLLWMCQVHMLVITLSSLTRHQYGLSFVQSCSVHAGVEPLSDEEGDVVECDGGESEQENETPVNDAVAAEEAMMERDAIGPYRVVL